MVWLVVEDQSSCPLGDDDRRGKELTYETCRILGLGEAAHKKLSGSNKAGS